MTYEMQRTKFEGFPFQYDSNLIRDLNIAIKKINNEMLQRVGYAISEYAEHLIHPQTKDGYDWFGGLIFKLKENAKVAVLFPWAQDWNNSETQSDRSINVYSDEKLPTEIVKGLLRKISSQYQILETKEKEKINSLNGILLH